MGLFCISMSDTPEAQLKAALGNLELYKKSLNPQEYSTPLDYLIGFVEKQIQDVIDLLAKQPD